MLSLLSVSMDISVFVHCPGSCLLKMQGKIHSWSWQNTRTWIRTWTQIRTQTLSLTWTCTWTWTSARVLVHVRNHVCVNFAMLIYSNNFNHMFSIMPIDRFRCLKLPYFWITFQLPVLNSCQKNQWFSVSPYSPQFKKLVPYILLPTIGKRPSKILY